MRERLIALAETAVEEMVEDIAATRPGAVLNTLVGASAYSFYTAWHAACDRRPGLAAISMLSLSLREAELKLIGSHRGGHIGSVYFRSVERPENAAFLTLHHSRYQAYAPLSVDTEAAYFCVTMLDRALASAGTDDVILPPFHRTLRRLRFELQ